MTARYMYFDSYPCTIKVPTARTIASHRENVPTCPVTVLTRNPMGPSGPVARFYKTSNYVDLAATLEAIESGATLYPQMTPPP